VEFGRPIPLAELSIGSARINQQPNQHVVDFQIVDADCRWTSGPVNFPTIPFIFN